MVQGEYLYNMHYRIQLITVYYVIMNHFPRKSSQEWRPESTDLEANTHAAPLTHLKDRDWKELALLFDRHDSDEIEADVINKLNMLCPEPSWDEDPHEFVREYL